MVEDHRLAEPAAKTGYQEPLLVTYVTAVVGILHAAADKAINTPFA
jgi:hypothetical protein